MAKKHKDPVSDAAASIRSLFSADNPFRRKPSTEEPPPPAPTATARPLRKHTNPDAHAAEPSAKKREEGPRRKRKRDEVEDGYERRRLGASAEEPAPPPAVGEKRKAPDEAAAAVGAGEEDEAFDDESKLLRTVFVGNLPLRTKRKALTKEFAAFGEVESVRIRSVPLTDTKIPRKGAVIKGMINELVDKPPPPPRRDMSGGRKHPAPLAGFSPFARSRLFSASGYSKPPPPPSTSAKPPQENATSTRDMPPKRVKRPEPSSDEERYSSDSHLDSYGSDDSSGELQTVQADFAFFDPKPSDFHGVKLLLKTYLDSKPWDLTGFVDLILSQTTVGTVVKMADEEEEEGQGNGGDDDDLFGLISVLNLGRYGEHCCIKDLKQYLLAVCGDKDTKKKLKSLLEEKASGVGLLVCRRFVNFPYELVPKLYDALFDEVSWATEDEPTQELRDSFRFKQYLLVARIFERKTPAKHKAKKSKDEDEPVIYAKLEDEIFCELSSWSFTFPIHAEQSAQQEMKNYKEMGIVMAVKAEIISKFRKKLEQLVSEQ